MFTKALSVVLLTCALFSGQLVAEESAEGLREHFYWQKSRKPEAGQR